VLEGSTTQCPHCQGTGIIRSTESVALAVIRGLEDALMAGARTSLIATTTAMVALYILNNKRNFINDMEARHGISIGIQASDKLQGANFTIEKGHAPVQPVRREERSAVNMDWGFEAEGDGAEDHRPEPFASGAETEHERHGRQDRHDDFDGRGDGGEQEGGGQGRRRRGRRRGRRGEHRGGEFRGGDRSGPGMPRDGWRRGRDHESGGEAGGSLEQAHGADFARDEDTEGSFDRSEDLPEKGFREGGDQTSGGQRSSEEGGGGRRGRRRGRRGGRRGRDRNRDRFSPHVTEEIVDDFAGDGVSATALIEREGESAAAEGVAAEGYVAAAAGDTEATPQRRRSSSRASPAMEPGKGEPKAPVAAAEDPPPPAPRVRHRPTSSEPKLERVVVRPDPAATEAPPPETADTGEPTRKGWWNRRFGAP
jgi:ribonuclease E